MAFEPVSPIDYRSLHVGTEWTDDDRLVTTSGSGTRNVQITPVTVTTGGAMSGVVSLAVTASSTSGSASANADNVVIEESGAQAGLTILTDNDTLGHIYFGDSGGSATGRITYHHGTDELRLYASNSKQVTIDSSGLELASGKTLTNAGGEPNFGTTTQTWGAGFFNELRIDKAAGNGRWSYYMSDNSLRWLVGANDTAETGSDAGSNFQFIAYDDSGTYIDSPFVIDRAAGGAIWLSRPVRAQNTSIVSHAVEVNTGGSGNRYAYIDLIGDDTYTDYGLRLIRNNTGANAKSELTHRGTGGLYVVTEEAGDIVFSTQGTDRVTIGSAGDLDLASGNALTMASNTVLDTNRLLNARSYAVASLPAAGTAGRVAYASDGRKAGEGAGAGSGVLVFDDGSNWIAVDTGATVAA